jgi:hypothetical protein
VAILRDVKNKWWEQWILAKRLIFSKMAGRLLVMRGLTSALSCKGQVSNVVFDCPTFALRQGSR